VIFFNMRSKGTSAGILCTCCHKEADDARPLADMLVTDANDSTELEIRVAVHLTCLRDAMAKAPSRAHHSRR